MVKILNLFTTPPPPSTRFFLNCAPGKNNCWQDIYPDISSTTAAARHDCRLHRGKSTHPNTTTTPMCTAQLHKPPRLSSCFRSTLIYIYTKKIDYMGLKQCNMNSSQNMVVHGYSQQVKLSVCGIKTIKMYRIRALYRVEFCWRKSSSTSRSTEAAQ